MPIEILQTMRVPGLSMAFLTVSVAISIFLPVALFIRFKVKYKSRLVPALLGAGMFILFALILEQLLIRYVLRLDLFIGVYPTPVSRQIIYVIVICLCSGIFEETARFIAFKWILKKDREDIKTPLAYGVGHGGIESIILMGVTGIIMLVNFIMINNGQIFNSASLTNDSAVNLIDVVQTDSIYFLVGGIERVSAIALHISLSVLVWLAITRRQYLLYPAAIMLHALMNVSAALFQLGVIENVLLVEGMIMLSALIAVALTRLAYIKVPKHKSLLSDPEPEPTEESV